MRWKANAGPRSVRGHASVRLPRVTGVLRVPGLAKGAGSEPAQPVVAVAAVPAPRPAVAGRPVRHVAVARVPENHEPTSVLDTSGPAAVPVFVDVTGRRRRLVSWLGCAVALLAVALVALLWLSQAGSPVDPDTPVRCDGAAVAGCGAGPAGR